MGDIHKYGIGFWLGGGVYSIINMIMNYKHALQNNILFYNYEITAVAIIGLILNIILPACFYGIAPILNIPKIIK